MAAKRKSSIARQRTVAELEAELRQRTVERDEALAQQAATAEVLDVINASPGNLAPVFAAVLEKAVRLCESEFGIFNSYDGECFHAVAMRGVSPALAEYLRQPIRSGPGLALYRIAQGEDVVHLADITDDDAYRSGDQGRRAVADLGGARTQLMVALRKDGTLLGAINVFRQEVRPFSDKQVALVQNFAAQVVVAMENARLLTETREALEQQTATAEVLQVINSSPGNLAPVFDAMLERATSLCHASFGILWDFDGEFARAGALHQVPESYAELCRIPFRPSPGSGPARIMRGEDTFAIADLLTGYTPYQTGDALTRALVDLAGARSVVITPLRKETTTLGAITLYRREVSPFTDKQIALLRNFAAQAVIAMENARLLTETREALEQQTAMADVLQEINASPGELKPVFDAILEKAHTICGAEYGVLLTYDGELFWPVAIHGHRLANSESTRHGIRPGFGFGRLVRGERFLHIQDMAEVAAQHPEDPVPRALVETSGVRTQLAVPLRRDGRLLGVITANRRQVRPFSEREITLIESFAAQAVIAMENARLLGELQQRTEEVAELNRGLEARVAAQVEELGRVGRLRRFLAPQLAELIVSQGNEKILESHRREIVVVFCDLRGYTAFTETAEPEEVLDFLREYHGALGPLVSQHEGTLDQFSGDGIMVFFNDPVPVPDPHERAIKMAVAMREAASLLIATWRRRGRDLGFGAGIAQGYATLGQIGFSDRSGYTAIGTVCNVAARLCAEAKDGQILLSQRIAAALDGSVALEELGPLALKGLSQPIVAYNVPSTGSQAAFRVINGRPHGTTG